ncbi:hypothetical protein DIPPA_07521 [Diplonema papillatum]|nr:hypothetical protein DIPPA_07521 [Diplonema papillatum]
MTRKKVRPTDEDSPRERAAWHLPLPLLPRRCRTAEPVETEEGEVLPVFVTQTHDDLQEIKRALLSRTPDFREALLAPLPFASPAFNPPSTRPGSSYITKRHPRNLLLLPTNFPGENKVHPTDEDSPRERAAWHLPLPLLPRRCRTAEPVETEEGEVLPVFVTQAHDDLQEIKRTLLSRTPDFREALLAPLPFASPAFNPPSTRPGSSYITKRHLRNLLLLPTKHAPPNTAAPAVSLLKSTNQQNAACQQILRLLDRCELSSYAPPPPPAPAAPAAAARLAAAGKRSLRELKPKLVRGQFDVVLGECQALVEKRALLLQQPLLASDDDVAQLKQDHKRLAIISHLKQSAGGHRSTSPLPACARKSGLGSCVTDRVDALRDDEAAMRALFASVAEIRKARLRAAIESRPTNRDYQKENAARAERLTRDSKRATRARAAAAREARIAEAQLKARRLADEKIARTEAGLRGPEERALKNSERAAERLRLDTCAKTWLHVIRFAASCRSFARKLHRDTNPNGAAEAPLQQSRPSISFQRKQTGEQSKLALARAQSSSSRMKMRVTNTESAALVLARHLQRLLATNRIQFFLRATLVANRIPFALKRYFKAVRAVQRSWRDLTLIRQYRRLITSVQWDTAIDESVEDLDQRKQRLEKEKLLLEMSKRKKGPLQSVKDIDLKLHAIMKDIGELRAIPTEIKASTIHAYSCAKEKEYGLKVLTYHQRVEENNDKVNEQIHNNKFLQEALRDITDTSAEEGGADSSGELARHSSRVVKRRPGSRTITIAWGRAGFMKTNVFEFSRDAGFAAQPARSKKNKLRIMRRLEKRGEIIRVPLPTFPIVTSRARVIALIGAARERSRQLVLQRLAQNDEDVPSRGRSPLTT